MHLCRRELGYGLGSLGDGVLGEFSREHETDGGLNLAGRESRLFVIGGELSSLTSNALEDVIDERVHDRHSLLADTGIGVDLLENLVDVGGVRFNALLALLFLALRLGGGGLGRGLLGGCFCHFFGDVDLERFFMRAVTVIEDELLRLR